MTQRIALTPGEPAGIGPDLCIQLCQQPPADTELVVVADPQLFRDRAADLGLSLTLFPFDASTPERPTQPGTLSILPVPLIVPVHAGELDRRNAAYVLETLPFNQT